MPAPPSAEALAALPPLREVVDRFGLRARKALGQHFILDLNLTRRIARAAGDLATGTVIEIGPGPGGLTRALFLEGARHVVAIERDQRVAAALADLVATAGGALDLVMADALAIDMTSLGTPPRRIVANLPYNIATPLLVRWLQEGAAYASLTLMFQKEVADRIVAAPGTAAYGRLSVLANWRCRTERCFNLPAAAFVPAPRVASSVVRLEPYPTPPHPADIRALERVTQSAFGQRRKTLRRALQTLPAPVGDLLAAAQIDGGRRAETLDIAEFAALARAFTVLGATP